MKDKLDRMGVLVLMSHLVITLVVLGIYGWSLASGTGDETLKTILTVIIGYWFGSMGSAAIRKPIDKKRQKEEMEKKGA